MPCNLFLLSLFDSLRFDLLLGHVLLAGVLLRNCGRLLIASISLSSLLRGYDFPFHFQGALAHQLILGVR